MGVASYSPDWAVHPESQDSHRGQTDGCSRTTFVPDGKRAGVSECEHQDLQIRGHPAAENHTKGDKMQV